MNKLMLAAMLAASTLTGGCAMAPSINVLGAYFPDWLFCIVGGLCLTVLLHLLASRFNAAKSITPTGLSLAYPALCALFALAGWLLFFQN